ncbi:RBPJ-interacting and tubulin-associated protein 1 isoform X2 [Bombina bombina]|nr:RBPJ-interacting and tubulin-associated protein 1 isoform X2 [Bombina bombina]XP_053558142.1 RBPJ-interacting and tubulin-associated protein 1 isoform X2 [Bombina bombina]XP_053558143.1 RBPJ-interacting and tubulin-associated protein 1 isoform X2 [Bombina bombina]
MSLDLSITGHRTSLPQHKSRSAYRFKAANSYVDETLFGSSGGKPDPIIKWNTATPRQKPLLWSPATNTETNGNISSRTSSTPGGTPRKKIQYRVKSRSPSYCDETLFGQKIEDCGWEAPWIKKEDLVRPRPLLWSPSPTIRPQNSKTVTKQLPLRAVHPPDVSDHTFETYKSTRNFWRPPDTDTDSEQSPSMMSSSLNTKSNRGPVGKDSARSVSTGRVTARRGSGSIQDKPPWK